MYIDDNKVCNDCIRDGIDFGILQSLSQRSGITDMVVTEEGRVWADCGKGLQEYFPTISLRSADVLRQYAVWLCSQFGKRLDDACPIVDASSASGMRIHAVLTPLVAQGAALSVRFPPQEPYNLNALVDRGMFPRVIKVLLYLLVRSRANVLVTGSTGSGKTTLMKAMLLACDAADRIVSVEETRELMHMSANQVALSVRDANVEGVGCIGLPQLVKATLRMRPDRIILGECRGEEIADLLRVFTSGHRGGMTTLHADEVKKVPARLMSLGLLAGLSPASLCALAAGAFDVVIHVAPVAGRRMIREFGVLHCQGAVLRGVPVLRLEPRGDTDMAVVLTNEWKAFAKRWQLPRNPYQLLAQ